MTEVATPPADLEALIAKAKAATPGPWKQRAHQFDDWGWIRSGEGNLVAIARAGHAQPVLNEHRTKGADPYEHNAAYIAAASPDVVLSLCEEIKRLRASSEVLSADLREVYRGMKAAGIYPEEGETHGAAIERASSVSPASDGAEPDMFWDASNPEIGGDLTDVMCEYASGEMVKLNTAYRAEDMWAINSPDMDVLLRATADEAQSAYQAALAKGAEADV